MGLLKMKSSFISLLIITSILLLCNVVIFLSENPTKDIVSYKELIQEDRIKVDQVYELNIDFIENGLYNYYTTGNRDYIFKKCREKGYINAIFPTIDEGWYDENIIILWQELVFVVNMWLANCGLLTRKSTVITFTSIGC